MTIMSGFVRLSQNEWVRIDSIESVTDFPMDRESTVITESGRQYGYVGTAEQLFELIGAVRDLVLGENTPISETGTLHLSGPATETGSFYQP